MSAVGEVDASQLAAEKAALRRQTLTARRRLAPIELIERAGALARHLLNAPEIMRAAAVSAYVSVGSEPGTGPLLDALADRGVRVLLPVLLPDGDLDWAPYEGADRLAPARLGLLEPTTSRLGPSAVATVDAVLCPALAVDRQGHRLGRGGGSYDRALARVRTGTWRCAIVYDEEVLPEVPAGLDDQVVHAAAAPGGLHRLR